MTQLDLFDPPRVHGSPTSEQAAESITECAASMRARVLAFIVSMGDYGATDDEIQIALIMAGNTERPRRRELVKAGDIVESGATRATTSGRAAVVWVANASNERRQEPPEREA